MESQQTSSGKIRISADLASDEPAGPKSTVGGSEIPPSPETAGICLAIQNPAIVVCESRIVHVNDSASGLFKETEDRSVIGKRLEEVFVGDRVIPVDLSLAGLKQSMVMALDGSMLEAEIRAARISWRGIPAVLLVFWKRPDQRALEMEELRTRVLSLEQTLEDSIVENAEINRCLQATKDAADAANRTKSEFLANMSHELRTPLNAIMGFSEIIMKEMLGAIDLPQYLEYARDIHSSSSHLLEIINDILDLSKVEAGRFELFEEKLDLNKVMRSVADLVKGRLTQKGQELDIRIDPDFPVLIADRRAMKQILLNLVSNSSKFMEREGRITVTARRVNDLAEISVADRGIGIAPEDIERVMAPFGQVDSALSRDHQGTGLGLPLVQSMVHLHQGRLFVKSAIGVGTTIRIVFPRHRIAEIPANER